MSQSREPKPAGSGQSTPPTPPIPPRSIAVLRRRLPPGYELLHIIEITSDLNDIIDAISEIAGQNTKVRDRLSKVKERVEKRLALYRQILPTQE